MTEAAGGVTPDEVRAATFAKPSFGKRGYDEKSVDDLLQLAARRLDGRGHLSADDLRGVVFRTSALLSRGYDRAEVDAFLTRVIDAVAARESADAR